MAAPAGSERTDTTYILNHEEITRSYVLSITELDRIEYEAVIDAMKAGETEVVFVRGSHRVSSISLTRFKLDDPERPGYLR